MPQNHTWFQGGGGGRGGAHPKKSLALTNIFSQKWENLTFKTLISVFQSLHGHDCHPVELDSSDGGRRSDRRRQRLQELHSSGGGDADGEHCRKQNLNFELLYLMLSWLMLWFFRNWPSLNYLSGAYLLLFSWCYQLWYGSKFLCFVST